MDRIHFNQHVDQIVIDVSDLGLVAYHYESGKEIVEFMADTITIHTNYNNTVDVYIQSIDDEFLSATFNRDVAVRELRKKLEKQIKTSKNKIARVEKLLNGIK